MICSLKLQRISHSFYNPSQASELPNMGINLWPGYSAKMQQVDTGMYLQIKPQYEVIRT